MTRIILTGAAGFIGSSVGPFLCDRGFEVIGVDNFMGGRESNLAWTASPGPGGAKRDFTLVRAAAGDAAVAALLRRGDVVVHLGAWTPLPQNQIDPKASYANNVADTAGFLEACRIAGVAHFILASSAALYENTPTSPQRPNRESDAVAPNLIYSLGKKHCEDLARSYYEVYGLPFTSLRFFNVFGPHQDAVRKHPPLVPYLIDSLQRGVAPTLHSDGSQSRDFIYVKDLVRLIGRLVDVGPLNTEINVASGKSVTIGEIVAAVQRVLGVTTEPIFRDPALLWDKTPALFEGAHPFPRARMVEEVVKYTLGDAAKAESLLGWTAELGLEDGIRDIIASS